MDNATRLRSIAVSPLRTSPTGAAEVTQHRPVQRLLLPLIVVSALLSQIFASSGNATVAWVTAIIFASFILVFNGPAWSIVPILINEMTLYGYLNPIFGIAQRYVVVAVAAIFALSAIFGNRMFVDIRMRRVLIPSAAFLLFVTVMNMQHSEDVYVYQYLRYQLVQLAILIVAACVLRRVSDVKDISTVVVAATVVVSLIVIWQHFAPSTAIYGSVEETSKGRAVGLTGNPVSLANQLIFVLPPLLGILMAMRIQWRRDVVMLAGSTLLIAVALNFTYTRSAVFAFVPAIIIMGLFFGGRQRMIILSMVVISVICYFALENTGLIGSRYYRDAEEDRSASSHAVLGEVSLAIALDNPTTGIGHEAFPTVSLDYTDILDDQAFEVGGVGSLGKMEPHNDFLNVWLSWGIIALVAFIGIFVGALRNFVTASKSRDPFLRGLAIGCIGGLVTYGVNSYYHNSMDSSAFLWLYAGLSVALARLVRTAAQASYVRSSPTRYRSSIS